MTAFQWAIDLAKQLIDANGEAAVLTVYETVANPDFPNEQAPSEERSFPARAVFLNYNDKEAGQTYKDGTEIHRDDKKVLMAAKGLPFSPNLQGSITRANGSVLRIVKIKSLDPDGPSIYFEVQARR